jgi:CheY-like chemotaxis protein
MNGKRKITVSPERDEVGLWVIEDDPVFRRAMQELVDASSGMRCERVFETCEEALQVLSDEGAPEIVLVDIGLPGMSGIEGIRRMKALSPSTEFIVLTIYESHQKVFEAICAGATGYLVKSLTPKWSKGPRGHRWRRPDSPSPQPGAVGDAPAGQWADGAGQVARFMVGG